MSGYDGYPQGRRGSRDDRERSPPRRDSRDYRGERSDSRSASQYGQRDDPQNQRVERRFHRDEIRGQSHGQERGHFRDDRGSGSSSSQGSSEKLPELPLDVPVPKSGREINLKRAEPQGTAGTAIVVAINHYVIKSLPVIKIYQYDVRMHVPVSSQRRGSEKVSDMQQAKAILSMQSIIPKDFVFDGVSTGWSTEAMIAVGEHRMTVIDLPGHKQDRPNQVEVAIRNRGTLNVRGLVDFLMAVSTESASTSNSAVQECLKALNAVYRQDPASRYITRPKGTTYFLRKLGLVLPLQSTGGVLEALRGIHQAVSITCGKLTLNVDVATSAFYAEDMCMIDVAKAFAGISPRQDLLEFLRGNRNAFLQACERLIGIFFNVKHLNEVKNSRKIRAQRLNVQGARATFKQTNRETGDSVGTTVADYFRSRYSISLRYGDLPLLVSRDGMFPMELCFTARGERYKEVLQGKETADFIKFATSPAFVRAQQIAENVRRLRWHELDTPSSFGLSVETKMMEVEARLLPCPIPMYGAGTERNPPSTGSWNLRGKQFLAPARISSWGLMYFAAGREAIDDTRLQAFMRSIMQAFPTNGLTTTRQLPAFLRGNPSGGISEIIKNLYGKTGDAFQKKPDLLMFLLHGPNTWIYKIIKNVCECELGVASQVMDVNKAMSPRGQLQYFGNIALKVNVKLGGTNSIVPEPVFDRRRYMMIGGDSSHPSPAQRRQIPAPPSWTALCGTYDSACSSYTGVASAQEAGVELISNLKVLVKELLDRYAKKNKGLLPESIIYWRDGIGESEVEAFINSEVTELRDACQETEQNIQITVVNVVKRHHTRMFPTDRSRGDRLGNVLPGTVVEASSRNDIFLVSQSALQGTCRPTRYSIVVDDNKLSPDQFQRITHGLTFGYARATRSVSVVPPVFYADQIAERARLHMREGEDGNQYLMDAHGDLTYTMYWQ